MRRNLLRHDVHGRSVGGTDPAPRGARAAPRGKRTARRITLRAVAISVVAWVGGGGLGGAVQPGQDPPGGRVGAQVRAAWAAVEQSCRPSPRPAGPSGCPGGAGRRTTLSPILPDLTGEMLDRAKFGDTRTLVLFWHPDCCDRRRMLDALRTWEANPPEDAPRLLVVSAGATDANLAMGLRATVVHHRRGPFGASGTPSAVLVNDHGRVVSPVARGAPAVLALAGTPSLEGAATVTAHI